MAQKWNGDKNFERGGYRPLNEGYSPGGEKGYKPIAQGGSLPKAPAGGTGERPAIRPKT
jgi:hypothetical protein